MMSIYKHKLLLALFCLIGTFAFAQQEQMYTQFLFHKNELNPAANTQDNNFRAQFSYRQQWIGFDGAPETIQLGVHLPIDRNRAGISLGITQHEIGISKRFNATGSFNYGFTLGKGKFNIGIDGQYRRLGLDFTDSRLVGSYDINLDPSFDRGSFNQSYFNFGLGLYYATPKYFLGVSAPRLLNQDVRLDESNELDYMEKRNWYIMGGLELAINDKFQLLPQILFKTTENSPLNVDFNLLSWYDDLLLGGIGLRSYRDFDSSSVQSINLLAGIKISQKFIISFSYDISLTNIRRYQDGSIELSMIYSDFSNISSRFVNPRFL